jgi:uncharacterized UPF0160 family protein
MRNFGYDEDEICFYEYCTCTQTHTHRYWVVFPRKWWRRKDEKLCQISGIPGCMVVHAGGCIGANHTYEGALAMAKKALQMRTRN